MFNGQNDVKWVLEWNIESKRPKKKYESKWQNWWQSENLSPKDKLNFKLKFWIKITNRESKWYLKGGIGGKH